MNIVGIIRPETRDDHSRYFIMLDTFLVPLPGVQLEVTASVILPANQMNEYLHRNE
jgi:hypothetical protein